ncbi:MAG: lamin tail domain-containing protein, partial [Phycisphaerales bacterium]
SLVTDLANLFANDIGIYANPGAQGQSWERPVSVELLYPDGAEGFQADGGLRIRGGYSRSRSNPKHAFRLFFRAEYGTPTLRYRLFDDEGVGEFDCVDLRTSQNYSWSYEGNSSDSHDTFVREVFSRDTQRDMGRPYTRSRYYHLYINGQYWGLFQTQERSEAAYAATYFGGDKDDYDVIKSRAGNGGYDIEATDGVLDNWRALWNASLTGFKDDATYYRVQGLNPDLTPNPAYPKLLDIDNLIDYMLCTYYVGDPDGPVSAWARVANNFYAIYNRVQPDGFKFFRHDAEHSLYSVNESRLFASTTTSVGSSFNQSNPLWMHTHLILHPEYRMRFVDRVYKHFFNEGALTPDVAADRFMARAEQIETAIIAESARWGDAKRAKPRTRDDDWLPDIEGMVASYFPRRTNVVLNQFKTQGWYPNIDPPTFSQAGGYLNAGDAITLQGGAGTLWYTLDGNDPRVPGSTPEQGDASALVPEEAAKRVLVPTEPVSDAWKGGEAFDDSAWISGSGGVGFERSTGYETYFDINLQSQMYNRNASCFIRIPFEVTETDLADLASLTFQARYDDGFVVYLNGTEIVRKNFAGTPAWNSSANTQNPDDAAVTLESFDVSQYIDKLQPGQNLLAIHAMNNSTTSSDFLISVLLSSAKAAEGGTPTGISPSALRYTEPIVLSQSTQVRVRSLSSGTWSALNEAVFSVGPVVESLRISEILYHPADDPNAEYVELTNVGDETINLNLVRFTKGIDYTFPSFELAPGGYCLLVRDLEAFEARYGGQLPVVGEYTGSLNNGGEKIELLDAAGGIIQSFEYEDDWFDLTDGLGFSLTVRDPQTAVRLSSKSVWRPSAHAGGSPGEDDSGQVPELGSVVINELLANPTGGVSDWIELHNTTAETIDIGDWFLSDDANDLTRYRIAAGTTIPGGGFIVFSQDQHFGNSSDPGCNRPFGLSKDGETVYLHSGSGGVLTGYSEQEKFDASEAGVSLGRWQKSTGSYNFIALTEPTPGTANAAPVIGPVVISEIGYHPVGHAGAEYVELLNVSDSAVTLYDPTEQAPWRFTDDPDDPRIELLFPSDQPVTLAPGEYLVLAKDLSLFQAAYTVPAGTQVLAWGLGKLADDGGKIQLSRPSEVDDDGVRQWIRVDRIVYSDGAHPQDFADGVDPWPVEANGQGQSLSRIDPQTYGNDPGNWQAAASSPGRANP